MHEQSSKSFDVAQEIKWMAAIEAATKTGIKYKGKKNMGGEKLKENEQVRFSEQQNMEKTIRAADLYNMSSASIPILGRLSTRTKEKDREGREEEFLRKECERMTWRMFNAVSGSRCVRVWGN